MGISLPTVSAPANLKPQHDIQGTTVYWVGGWGATLSVLRVR